MNEHIDLGAYLLGGLDHDEALAFETHLSTCGQCREELASLSPVTSRLGVLDPQMARELLAEQPAVPVSDPGVELLDRLRASRRNRRTLLGAAAVAAVAASVAGGVFLAPVLRPVPGPDASYAVVSAAGPRMNLGLNAKAWGTELKFSGTDLPTQGTLSLWVIDDSGHTDKAGSWNATQAGTARVSGAVPTELGNISAIQLRGTNSKILAELSLPSDPRSVSS